MGQTSQAARRWWGYRLAAWMFKFEQNQDPLIQADRAIKAGKQRHATVVKSASAVIAQGALAQQDLNRLRREQTDLENEIRTGHGLMQGHINAGRQADADQMQGYIEETALKLRDVLEQIAVAEQDVLEAARAASKAEELAADNKRQLDEQERQHRRIRSNVTRTQLLDNMERAQADTLAALESGIPSLDEIERRTLARGAEVTAHLELSDKLSGDAARRQIKAQARSTQANDLIAQVVGGKSATSEATTASDDSA